MIAVIREQSRTLYGTRDNGRSGDPVKILRRNYANTAMAVSTVPQHKRNAPLGIMIIHLQRKKPLSALPSKAGI
jgi:hypothetical protein